MMWDSALQTRLMITFSIIFNWKLTKQDYFSAWKTIYPRQNIERCRECKIHVKFCPTYKKQEVPLKDSNVTHHQKKLHSTKVCKKHLKEVDYLRKITQQALWHFFSCKLVGRKKLFFSGTKLQKKYKGNCLLSHWTLIFDQVTTRNRGSFKKCCYQNRRRRWFILHVVCSEPWNQNIGTTKTLSRFESPQSITYTSSHW